MESKAGGESADSKAEAESKAASTKDGNLQQPGSSDNHSRAPKKRRKVNHACVYCRRSHMTCDLERPCTRCIKRNIGHLCHDEPRENESKKARSTMGTSTIDESETQSEIAPSTSVDPTASGSMGPPSSFEPRLNSSAANQSAKSADFRAAAAAAALGRTTNPLLAQAQASIPGLSGASGLGQFSGFSDVWLTQNHYHDMHNYHNNYMITPEVHNEFNLLNDFLHSSLLGDEGLLDQSPLGLEGVGQGDAMSGLLSSGGGAGLLPPSAIGGGAGIGGAGFSASSLLSAPGNAELAKAISRPGSVVPVDRDKMGEYYLQAADPSGNDTPEERMQRLLRAKYEAGLLKPFNYIKGYARLSTYLDSHIAASSKQKILRQLDRFRPKFREKVHALTDMELVYVEMWFEKTLMDYDRVFASMAIPACCWRRTGEIFKGNKEMAELIGVPVESLRDGKIALHEILTEESVVRYWEEFGTIAFDPAHDTLLTACSLKNPDDTSKDTAIKCCFSLKIRRDDFKMQVFLVFPAPCLPDVSSSILSDLNANILSHCYVVISPSLIVGNFLPHDPPTD